MFHVHFIKKLQKFFLKKKYVHLGKNTNKEKKIQFQLKIYSLMGFFFR